MSEKQAKALRRAVRRHAVYSYNEVITLIKEQRFIDRLKIAWHILKQNPKNENRKSEA